MGGSLSTWSPLCNGAVRVELSGHRTTSDRGALLLRAMGWIDLSNTDTLRRDTLWQLACSDARWLTPLAQARPFQVTLSMLFTCLGRDDNIDAIYEGLLRLVIWPLAALKNGERPARLTLDIDGLPIAVHGHQGGVASRRTARLAIRRLALGYRGRPV